MTILSSGRGVGESLEIGCVSYVKVGAVGVRGQGLGSLLLYAFGSLSLATHSVCPNQQCDLAQRPVLVKAVVM